MNKFVEVQIFPKVTKSYEDVSAAISIFENLLAEGETFNSADYYKARNFFKSAESLFQEALANAKKILGPLPEYASDEFIHWRTEMLEEHHILARSQEFEELKSELENDDIMKAWLEKEEVERFLKKHFQTQQEGKRKLVNIKVRIVLDKLQELIVQAKDLQKKAFEKQQSVG
jgi:tetratricopeptide (TPR) repeat protein